MNRKDLYDFTVSTLSMAAQLALSVQKRMITPTTVEKNDKSPVTVGDLAIQALVSCRLAQFFPSDQLVGEESSSVFEGEAGTILLNQVCEFVCQQIPNATPEQVKAWIDRGAAQGHADRYWVLDPIDGTKGFLRRQQYATALALIEKNPETGSRDVVFGGLGCPHLTDGWKDEVGGPGSILVAEKGSGAFVLQIDGTNPRKIAVSNVSDPIQARILRSVEAAHTNTGHLGQIVETLQTSADPVLMDSQAKYACLATGHAEVLLRLISSKMPNYKEKIWDQAAGLIVLQEAGGRITDLDGKPLDFNFGRALETNRGVCASNGQLHDKVLAAIKRVGA